MLMKLKGVHMERPVLLANASFVTPRLLVGGDLAVRDDLATAQLEELAGLGLTHIVDARIEWSDESRVAAMRPALRYLHHGMDDAGQRVPCRWFETGVAWVRRALAEPGTVVLTHCHMG